MSQKDKGGWEEIRKGYIPREDRGDRVDGGYQPETSDGGPPPSGGGGGKEPPPKDE